MAQTKHGALKVAAGRIGVTPAQYASHVLRGEKWCHKCAAWHPLAEFTVDRHRGDGLSAACAKCRSSRRSPGPSIRERRLRRLQGLAWCRGCEEWLAIDAVNDCLCRPCKRAADRAAYRASPRLRDYRRQRTAMRRRGVDAMSQVNAEFVLEDFDGQCAYCDAVATTWDHVVPVSRGGATSEWNMVPACASCNSSKGARDLDEFLVTRPRAKQEAIVSRLVLEHLPLYSQRTS